MRVLHYDTQEDLNQALLIACYFNVTGKRDVKVNDALSWPLESYLNINRLLSLHFSENSSCFLNETHIYWRKSTTVKNQHFPRDEKNYSLFATRWCVQADRVSRFQLPAEGNLISVHNSRETSQQENSPPEFRRQFLWIRRILSPTVDILNVRVAVVWIFEPGTRLTSS